MVVDKTPMKNIYKFEAREDVSPYSEIGRIDVPAGFQIAISDTSFPGYFSVNPASGILRSEARLDHEANPRVVINVKATSESGGDEFSSQILIDITDVNDNAPEFAVPLVVLSVPENFPSGCQSYKTFFFVTESKVVFTLWRKSLQARTFFSVQNIFLCLRMH